MEPKRPVTLHRAGPYVLLVLSFAALAVAPWLMPPSYDWIDHTTSESAAQGVENARIARLGFASWGMAAMWLGGFAFAEHRFRSILLVTFGLSMLAAAAFSTRPWEPVGFNILHDQLHTFFASAMGAAFIIASASSLFSGRGKSGFDWTSGLALAAAVAMPALMAVRPDVAGAAQRIMFLTAYLWFFREASLLERPNRAVANP